MARKTRLIYISTHLTHNHVSKHTLLVNRIQTGCSPSFYLNRPGQKNLKISQTPPSFTAHNLHEGKSYWLYFKNISRNRWVLTYSIVPTLLPVTIISHLNYLQWFCLVPADPSPQRTRVVLKYNSDQVHSSAQNPSVASQITQGKSPSVNRGLQDPRQFDLKPFKPHVLPWSPLLPSALALPASLWFSKMTSRHLSQGSLCPTSLHVSFLGSLQLSAKMSPYPWSHLQPAGIKVSPTVVCLSASSSPYPFIVFNTIQGCVCISMLFFFLTPFAP